MIILSSLDHVVREGYRIPFVGDLYRFLQRSIWLFRFRAKVLFSRILPAKESKTVHYKGLEGLDCIFINLDVRKDRKHQVEEELEKLGIKRPTRHPGVSRNPPILGCTLAHASALAEARRRGVVVMICEDDVEFTGTIEDIENSIAEFCGNPLLDVLCLAYNLGSKPQQISENLAVTSDTQTASCYVVKFHAMQPLINIFHKGAKKLERGSPSWAAANDVIWKRLQRGRLTFAIPSKPLARQRASFSDIEGAWVDYGV